MKRLPSDRSRLLHASIALCAVALLLSPLAARSARELPSESSASFTIASVTPPPAETPFPKIYVERDPFAAPPEMVSSSRAEQSHVIVRAVASGAKASALIEEDGQTRLVSIGDRVDSSSVTSIDTGGIVLANGARVRLEEVQP